MTTDVKRIPLDDINDLVESVKSAENYIVAICEVDDFLTSASLISHIEDISIEEAIVKRVSFDGKISRMKDRKTRMRQAFQTTGLSKAERRRIARKSARTLRQRPGIVKKKNRKRGRAMKRRKSMGIKDGQ